MAQLPLVRRESAFAGFRTYRLIADEWLFARAFRVFHVRFKIDELAPHALLPITDAVKIFLGSDKKPSPGKSKRGLAFFTNSHSDQFVPLLFTLRGSPG